MRTRDNDLSFKKKLLQITCFPFLYASPMWDSNYLKDANLKKLISHSYYFNSIKYFQHYFSFKFHLQVDIRNSILVIRNHHTPDLSFFLFPLLYIFSPLQYLYKGRERSLRGIFVFSIFFSYMFPLTNETVIYIYTYVEFKSHLDMHLPTYPT